MERAAKVAHLTPIATPRPTPGSPLILVGGSVRAAVQSAVRAGYSTWAADAFGDADLAAISATIRVSDYPQGLIAALRDAPAGPLIYTGALENSPQLLRTLSRQRLLWGNPPEVLRAVRDPAAVAAAWNAHHIAAPQLWMGPRPPSLGPRRGGRWLRKHLRSAGGEGIHFEEVTAEDARSTRAPPSYPSYWQEFVSGTPLGAVFLAAGRSSRLWGVSRQLLGQDWPRSGGFCYAGSIGPFPLNPESLGRLEQIGQILASAFELRGLFGIDVVLDDLDERNVWPIEVNPRWTASVELIERWTGENAIRLHIDACTSGRLPPQPAPQARAALDEIRKFFGKLIVYADRPRTISAKMAADWMQRVHDARWPAIADLPVAPQQIPPRWPICTVFGEGATPQEVERHLIAARTEILRDCEA